MFKYISHECPRMGRMHKLHEQLPGNFMFYFFTRISTIIGVWTIEQRFIVIRSCDMQK